MFKVVKNNFEMIVISNKYKNTLDDFINSSDIEFLNWPKLINKKLHNTSRFKSSLIDLLEGRRLESKNILNMLSKLRSKI